MKDVRVRMAPSPTGLLHVGTARSSLFNYLFARQHKGTFIFRIEDTDRERSKPEFEKDILDGIAWLGLSYDEFYRQSDRLDIYKQALKKLLDSGHAYVSKEEAPEGGRDEVIRFKNPNKKITFDDMIRGPVTFDTTELKDFVIAKSVDEPLYHLAVVVDDADMNISHIIRGDDHISNTPRQILIQEALGALRPLYAHLPLVLAPDRSKLSKRKHGEIVSISHYRNEGYLPEALNNFMAFLGWNPGDGKELLSLPELIKSFDITKVQKSGAVFAIEKLNWINSQYIKKMSDADFITKAKAFLPETYADRDITIIAPLLKERVETFQNIRTLEADGELEYFFTDPTYPKELLVWKKSTSEKTCEHLEQALDILTNFKTWNAESIKTVLWDYAEKVGKGDFLWPIRIALSGKEKSPDPFTLLSIIGKDNALARIKKAHALLS